MCKLKAEPPGLSMRMHPFATVDRFPRCVTFIQITLAKQEDWMAAVSHLLYEQRALALNPIIIIKQRGVSFQHRNKRYSLVHVLMRNRLQKRFAPSLLLIQCNDNEAIERTRQDVIKDAWIDDYTMAGISKRELFIGIASNTKWRVLSVYTA